ncbi:MAG: hypothetical protein DDT23_00579 [candidate division WS2 bacterium]|nr:hypothetical protein [Candidatus Lithacetigena glycinireducens]
MEILERLKSRSEIMLLCDETKLKELKDAGYPSHPPETHSVIMGDFGYQENQKKLKEWIDLFNEAMGATISQQEITKVDVKEKSHEIAFITSKFCLPAPSMLHLANTEKVYLERLKRGLPPPLHILKGEKAAYKYETEIAEEYQTIHEKLHPRVVSILENEILVRRVLLAKALNLFQEGEVGGADHKVRKYLQLKDERFFSEEERPLYLSDVIYDLFYPQEGKEVTYTVLIDNLGKEVTSTYEVMDKQKKKDMKEEKIKEFKSKALEKELPQREKDLYKVWTIMLKHM